MKKPILFFTMLLFGISVFSQENNYFDKKRDYIYNTIYIDSLGDTIITEKLILRVLDRRWIAQPGLQKSIRYIYNTDTAAYKNFINPDAYQHERNQRRYKNRGKFPLSKKSTTGGYQNEHYFYMHPPRTNQYYMLFHAAHPRFHSRVLEKGTDTLTFTDQQLYGAGYMRQEYIYEIFGKQKMFGDSISLYKVDVSSELISDKERFINKPDHYSSTLDALFSYEYGFIKMHYEFKSGVRIEFDLVEVIENDE
nr:hypothetical protein [uncultured Brumimicrobium sp.]